MKQYNRYKNINKTYYLNVNFIKKMGKNLCKYSIS